MTNKNQPRVHVVSSKSEFVSVASTELFEYFRHQIHEIDAQADAQGASSPDLLPLLLCDFAGRAVQYAAYMASGMYFCEGRDDEAREVVKNILRDMKEAAKSGLQLGEKKADEIVDKNGTVSQAVSDMLDRIIKSAK